MTFIQLAEGVDDEIWLCRLRIGDFSRWLGVSITDDLLASSGEKLERMGIPARLSRPLIKKLIEERHSLPS